MALLKIPLKPLAVSQYGPTPSAQSFSAGRRPENGNPRSMKGPENGNPRSMKVESASMHIFAKWRPKGGYIGKQGFALTGNLQPVPEKIKQLLGHSADEEQKKQVLACLSSGAFRSSSPSSCETA